MTERWETQIRKVREVEPGPGLGARFEEGPRGEPTPPTRQRVVAAVTALALFLAAGVFAVRVFGTGDEPAPPPAAAVDEGSLVLELASGENAPTATMRFGDQEQEGVAEGNEWCHGDECSGMIADFVRYPPVFELLVVPPSTEIEVAGDGSVERVRTSTLDGEPVEGSPLRLPASNGAFVLEVDATWSGDPHGSGNFFFGVQTLDDVSSAPDVLNVDCGAGATLIDSAVVRTQADGLHMAFTNTDGYVGYELLTPEGTPPEQLFSVGHRFGEDGSVVAPFQPGRWEVGCRAAGEEVEAGISTMTFELVDPDDHYADWELSCGDAIERPFVSSIPGSTPHEEAAAQLVAGLQEGDRLRGAGYGADSFVQGPTYVVQRGRDSVARLVLGTIPDGDGSWAGTFTGCEGSGIELSELVPTAVELEPTGPSSAELSPLPETIPDVLVVRCEGLGPAVDSTQVRLQEDGLHVQALNVADAEVIEIRRDEPQDEAYRYRSEFTSPEMEVVVPASDLGPGEIIVGCRVTDENGDVVGGPVEVPDAYLAVDVLPAE